MSNPAGATQPKQVLMVSRIIWVALTVSLHIYMVIAFLVHKDATPVALEGSLGIVLSLAAASMGGMSLFFRNRSFPQGTPVTVDQKWFTAHVISWALNESVAILGFVLAFLTHEPMRILPFFAGALALNLIMFPKDPVSGLK